MGAAGRRAPVHEHARVVLLSDGRQLFVARRRSLAVLLSRQKPATRRLRDAVLQRHMRLHWVAGGQWQGRVVLQGERAMPVGRGLLPHGRVGSWTVRCRQSVHRARCPDLSFCLSRAMLASFWPIHTHRRRTRVHLWLSMLSNVRLRACAQKETGTAAATHMHEHRTD